MFTFLFSKPEENWGRATELPGVWKEWK